jgi:hypothetical protein
MFISASCIYAGDVNNVASDGINIDLNNDSNIISTDFNQVDNLPISLDYTNESIENNTIDVVNNQLCSYSVSHYENSVECGGFVFSENCFIKIGENDITNTYEFVGCSKTTDDVKILNLTFTNSLPSEMSISSVGYLCSNVMSPFCCFGDSVGISDFALSSIAATSVDANGESGNNVGSDQFVLHVSPFSIASEIHLNGANNTICNIYCVNNSTGLSEESLYNRNRKNINISPSFDRDFTILDEFAFNVGMNHYNCSDNIDDVSMDMASTVSQFIDNNVNVGSYIVGDSGFALTANETFNEFDFVNSKDVMDDIYIFLFIEDNSNAFSLVKNTYHCNKHCEIFGINPIYLLEYEANIADNFAFYYNDQFLNSIFSNFFLTDCAPHQDYINTIFEDSYTISCNNIVSFSGICFGICNLTESKTGFCAILFVEDENAGVITSEDILGLNADIDDLASCSLLDTLSLNNIGINYCIQNLSLAIGGFAMNSKILCFKVDNGIIKHVGINEEIINTEFTMDSNISYCFKVDNGIFKHVGIIKKVINTEFGMDSIISCFKVDNGIIKHVEIIDGVINWGIYYVLNESEYGGIFYSK